MAKNDKSEDQTPAVDPAVAAEPEAAPVVEGKPFYLVKAWFNHFGREFNPGDKVSPKDLAGAPKGTIERRIENGFLDFVAG